MKCFKKFLALFSFFLFFTSLFIPQNANAFNVPTKTIDQACTTPSAGTNFVNMTVPGTFQTFSPTMETLDSVSAFISAAPGTTVQVRAKIFHHATSGVMENFAISINTVTLTDTPNWKAFEMDNKPMPAGIYSLMIDLAVRNGGEFFWYAKDDGNCYPNGYAVIDSHPNQNKDFNFVIFGKNSIPSSASSSVVPSASNNTAPDSSSSDSTSATNEAIDEATDATGDSSSDSSTSSTEAPKVTASSNKQSADAKDFMASPEKQKVFNQAMIDALIADFKKDNPPGIFGIGGFVGDILTWTNIAIFFGLIILIVLGIVFLGKRKNPNE